jgi:hypothetical protein
MDWTLNGKPEINDIVDSLGEGMSISEIFGHVGRQRKKDRDKTKTKKKEKGPFEIDIEALKKNHELALQADKDNLLKGKINQDEFDKREREEKLGHLELMKSIYEAYGEDITELDGQILDQLLENQAALADIDEDPFKGYRNSLGELGKTIADFTGTKLKDLENGLAEISQSLGDELAQGAESFEEYGKNVLGVLRDIIGGLISAGVAAAVTKALKDHPWLPFWAIPIVAGAAAGLAKTAFNSLIPRFAEGGLVTGPTTALIGEGIGTTAANPEVVAPLDKLKQYMGGGQNITVQGRLVGNDIYISNERTKFNRNRTV